MRRGLLSVAAVMVVLAFAGVWHGGYAESPPPPTASASMVTRLAGTNEVPPDKSTATGMAKITVDAPHDQVCWDLSAQNLQGTVTEAHIHRAPAGKEGPIVLGLSPPAGGSSRGCKRVRTSLARGIVKDPGAYYVNVHTSKFPGGEIRGQL